MDIILYMFMHQVNAKTFQSIKVGGLFKMPEGKPNNGDQSNNKIFRSFKTLEESISLV